MTRYDKFVSAEESEVPAIVQSSDAGHLHALQRHIAEARLRQSSATIPEGVKNATQYSTIEMLHELRVHQIELEMQNEALHESQIALHAVGTRYFDLYDLAPIAYCTVNEKGLIWQANLAAAGLLGIARNALLNQPISRHIYLDDQATYYFGRRRLSSSGESQSLELRMIRQNGTSFWAGIGITNGKDISGKTELRIVFSDIDAYKTVEAQCAQLRKALLDTDAKIEQTFSAANHSNQDKLAYLVNMSLELEVRLDAMLTASRLAEDSGPSLTQDQKRDIAQIENAGRRLLILIKENIDPATVGNQGTAWPPGMGKKLNAAT